MGVRDGQTGRVQALMHRKLPLQQHSSKIVMHGWHRVPFMTTHANGDWQDKTQSGHRTRRHIADTQTLIFSVSFRASSLDRCRSGVCLKPVLARKTGWTCLDRQEKTDSGCSGLGCARSGPVIGNKGSKGSFAMKTSSRASTR